MKFGARVGRQIRKKGKSGPDSWNPRRIALVAARVGWRFRNGPIVQALPFRTIVAGATTSRNARFESLSGAHILVGSRRTSPARDCESSFSNALHHVADLLR
jgi:hypothetical protein